MNVSLGQRHIIWLLALFLSALLLWRPWSATKPDIKKLWSIDLSSLEADITLEGVRYTRSENGKPLWVMDAKLAKIYEDKNIVKLEKIVLYLFQNNGENLRIDADKGRYDIKQKLITLAGNVVLKSEGGYTLKTEVLNFNQADKLLWSEKPVVINSTGLEIKGHGFRYYVSDGRFLVFNQQTTIKENDLI